MDKLPPVICGACGMEFEGSGAAANAHLHILREHPIDVESSNPTSTFDEVIEKKTLEIIKGFEPIGHLDGTSEKKMISNGYDLDKDGRTEFGFYWEYEDMAMCANKIATEIVHQAVVELMDKVIGEDEKSKHIRRFQCPNYGDNCYEWAEQWKMNSNAPYCSSDGKKMKSVEFDEPEGDDWTRNELRAEQRATAHNLLEALDASEEPK